MERFKCSVFWAEGTTTENKLNKQVVEMQTPIL